MSKVLLVILMFISLFILLPQVTFAQSNQPTPSEFLKAQVLSIDKTGEKDVGVSKNFFQDVSLRVLDGRDQGKTIQVENGGETTITEAQKVKVGETVVLTKILGPDNNPQYFIVDKYRLNYLPILIIGFFVLIVMVAGVKGLRSMVGLVINLLIISGWVVPQILHGQDPLFISITASMVILLLTTYLAHGISKQTTIALAGTFISLLITALLAIVMAHLASLTGVENEDAYTLQLGPLTQKINLQGLLLGGIIIGALGALNDVTVTQSVTMFELAKGRVNQLNFQELVKRGLSVGREHIVSIVNTLVLAYAGSSLAILIFFVLNPTQQPYWVILNSETIFDEILRTVVGSVGLALAVPNVTLLAAWYLSRTQKRRHVF